VPAGQGEQMDAAPKLYVPAPQRAQLAFEEAPVVDQVPGGQGVGFTEDSGQ
jgi:hypothetical protein